MLIRYRATPAPAPAGLNDPEAFDAHDRAPWVNAETLTIDQRATLKARVEDGTVQEIRAWFRVFGNERNMRRVRPIPEKFGMLAKGKRELAFKKDHWRGAGTVIGRIFDRRLTTRADGVDQLELAHRITDRQAMIDYLDLRMTDFSVELTVPDQRCSECGKPAGSFFGWSVFDCACDDKGLNPELLGHGDPELTANAWVDTGAYRDTGVSANFSAERDGGLIPPELRAKLAEYAQKFSPSAPSSAPTPNEGVMPPTQEEFAALQAQLAAAQQATSEADARAKAAEDARFAAAFDAAVGTRRTTPAQRAHFERLYAGMGIDFALETLAQLAPDPRYASEPVGFATAPDAGASAEAPPNPWAASEAAVRHGLLKPETLERAKAAHLRAVK